MGSLFYERIVKFSTQKTVIFNYCFHVRIFTAHTYTCTHTPTTHTPTHTPTHTHPHHLHTFSESFYDLIKQQNCIVFIQYSIVHTRECDAKNWPNLIHTRWGLVGEGGGMTSMKTFISSVLESHWLKKIFAFLVCVAFYWKCREKYSFIKWFFENENFASHASKFDDFPNLTFPLLLFLNSKLCFLHFWWLSIKLLCPSNFLSEIYCQNELWSLISMYEYTFCSWTKNLT